MKRIFRYVQVIEGLNIAYSNNHLNDVKKRFVGCTDSDWAGSFDQRSTSGSVLFYEGYLVHRKSRKQKLVTTSTTEVEMILLVKAFNVDMCVH